MITINTKAKIKINNLGNGGNLFYTLDIDKNPWLGAWMFKCGDERELLSDNVFLYFTDSCKFEPGNEYIIKITLFVNEATSNKINPGDKFKIQAGILYDNKYWATGEIMEILDEKKLV